MHKIIINNEEILFSSKELFGFLLEKIHKEKLTDIYIEDLHNYIESINELLPKELLTNKPLNDAFSIMFLSGYYYNKFLQKNTVEIIKKEKDKED